MLGATVSAMTDWLIGAPTGRQPRRSGGARFLDRSPQNDTGPIARLNGSGSLWPRLAARGTDAPNRCRTSRQYSLYLHTHVAETRSEADAAEEMYGCRMVKHLDEPRVSRAAHLRPPHRVWIDDEEIELIARSGAVMAHNPISNMALGSGIAPVKSMIRAKAHVALGTDAPRPTVHSTYGRASSPAALLARCGTPEPADGATARERRHACDIRGPARF